MKKPFLAVNVKKLKPFSNEKKKMRLIAV